MQGSTLYTLIADILARVWVFLQTPLFYLGTKPVTFWNVSLSLMFLMIFRDFLDILGIWGYGTDDIDSEGD